MKKFMKVLLAGVSVVAITLGIAGCNNNKQDTIAVIAKGSTHAFWQAVKAGTQKAGEEFGYKISFTGPEGESSSLTSQQKTMVSSALGNKPKALVLATIGTGFVDELKAAFDSKIPVVEFDSGIFKEDKDALGDKNPIISSVATSNKEAAALAGEKMFEAIKADIAAKSATDKYLVGIIQHDNTATGVDRMTGFKDKFIALADADATTNGKYTIAVEAKDGDIANAYVTALEALQTKGAKAIFMTNEGVVNQLYGQMDKPDYQAIKFCGYDAGTAQIQWMKKANSNLIGSVAQDSINIGYEAVKQAVLKIQGKEFKGSVSIKGSWWNKNNVDQMIKDKIVYEG